jgi:hypothetical protein
MKQDQSLERPEVVRRSETRGGRLLTLATVASLVAMLGTCPRESPRRIRCPTGSNEIALRRRCRHNGVLGYLTAGIGRLRRVDRLGLHQPCDRQ